MFCPALSVTERAVVDLFCDFLGVSILFRCKHISPSSCAVSLLSRQSPSSAVTYIVATVIRFQDSTNVWNFPFILTGSVEFKWVCFNVCLLQRYITQLFKCIFINKVDC